MERNTRRSQRESKGLSAHRYGTTNTTIRTFLEGKTSRGTRRTMQLGRYATDVQTLSNGLLETAKEIAEVGEKCTSKTPQKKGPSAQYTASNTEIKICLEGKTRQGIAEPYNSVDKACTQWPKSMQTSKRSPSETREDQGNRRGWVQIVRRGPNPNTGG